MALKSKIFKADLQIADLDRNHHAHYRLTLARHPSETEERMMMRLLAFALYAKEGLSFGRGLCVGDEPALWCKGSTGEIELWIEVGLPDGRRLGKACGRARRAVVLCYGGRGVDVWWKRNRDRLMGLTNLTVLNVPTAASQALASLANRTMRLQCTIEGGRVWVTGEDGCVAVDPEVLQSAAVPVR